MYEIYSKLLKEKGYTSYRVAKECGISQSSLSDWKRGVSKPKHGKMLRIAKLFGVSVDYLETGIKPEVKTKKPAISGELNEAAVLYTQLNKVGQKEYVRYGKYLVSQKEYRADEAEKPEVEYIRHYLTAAAAGYAAPIEGEDFELIERPAGAPARADFCINICGDSMEPYIGDGQMVYVERGADLQDGDTGIFFVDGDVYCKQFCRDYIGDIHLLSANPKREDANIHIKRDSAQHIVCFGKVILGHRLPMPVYL